MRIWLTQRSHPSLNSPKKKSYPCLREPGTWSRLSYDPNRSGVLKKHKPFPNWNQFLQLPGGMIWKGSRVKGVCSCIPASHNMRTGGGFGKGPVPDLKTTTSPTAPSPVPGILWLPPAQWAGTWVFLTNPSPLHLFSLGLGSNLPLPPLPLPNSSAAG